MAVRQRPQAPNPLYKLRPIVLSIAPCWHAITQAVFTFDFCLVFFFYFFPSLLISSLTSLPMFLSSSRELFLPSVNPLAPGFSLSCHSLLGTRSNSITERRKWSPCLSKHLEVICALFLFSSLTLSSHFFSPLIQHAHLSPALPTTSSPPQCASCHLGKCRAVI